MDRNRLKGTPRPSLPIRHTVPPSPQRGVGVTTMMTTTTTTTMRSSSSSQVTRTSPIDGFSRTRLARSFPGRVSTQTASISRTVSVGNEDPIELLVGDDGDHDHYDHDHQARIMTTRNSDIVRISLRRRRRRRRRTTTTTTTTMMMMTMMTMRVYRGEWLG